MNKWLDRSTKLLVVEIVLYNSNSDLLAVVNLLCEFPITGGIVPTAVIEPFRSCFLLWSAFRSFNNLRKGGEYQVGPKPTVRSNF